MRCTVLRLYCADEMFSVSGAGYAPEGGFSVNGGTLSAPTDALRQMLIAGTLASDTSMIQLPGGGWDIKGDPTEGALVVAAAKAGMQKDDLDAKHPRVHEVPFSSETKRMTTLHKSDGKLVANAKGAPEVILDGCDFVLTAEGVAPLDKPRREEILARPRPTTSWPSVTTTAMPEAANS